MFIDKDKVTEIFVLTDEFCNEFTQTIQSTVWAINPKESLK
jgi:hypothetical protein